MIFDTFFLATLCIGAVEILPSGGDLLAPTERRRASPAQIDYLHKKNHWEMDNGWCLTPSRNYPRGVIALDSQDGFSDDRLYACLRKCKRSTKASYKTGCMLIYSSPMKGCYLMTQAVTQTDNRAKHICWIFKQPRKANNLPVPIFRGRANDDCWAEVFAHPGFQGWRDVITDVGRWHDMEHGRNDRVSSIRVHGSCTLVASEHFVRLQDGRVGHFEPGWHDHGAVTARVGDDVISNVKLQPLADRCNWECYLDRYADLRKAYGTGWRAVEKAKGHFSLYGFREGRNCFCDGNYAFYPGKSECPAGAEPITDAASCKRAVDQLAPKHGWVMPPRGLQQCSSGDCAAPGWDKVPLGCSLQGAGDNAPHWVHMGAKMTPFHKRLRKTGSNGLYNLICLKPRCKRIVVTNYEKDGPISFGVPKEQGVSVGSAKNCAVWTATDWLPSMTNSVEEQVSDSYTRSKSWENTFTHGVTSSVTVTVSGGLEFFVEGDTSTGTTFTSKSEYSVKEGAESSKTVGTVKRRTKTLTTNWKKTVPAWVWWDMELVYQKFEGTLKYKADAICLDDKGRELEKQKIKGTYTGVAIGKESLEVVDKTTDCENRQQGCKCAGIATSVGGDVCNKSEDPKAAFKGNWCYVFKGTCPKEINPRQLGERSKWTSVGGMDAGNLDPSLFGIASIPCSQPQ